MIEMIVSIAIVGVLAALILPAVQSARESARSMQCFNNLRQFGVALHAYHETHRLFPPAVVWNGGPGEPLGAGQLPVGPIDRVAIGYSPANGPDRVLANWAILLLPVLEQDNLYKKFDSSKPVDDPVNAAARGTSLSVMLCPSDPYNNKPYERALLAGVASGHTYARGNYAMNFGPNAPCFMGQSGCTDGFYVDSLDFVNTNMHVWGSGLSGLNISFKMRDFPGGTSRFVALDEVRAGIDPIDPRGVWALGMAGASVTVRQGIYNPDGGTLPNSQSASADDIVGCGALQAKYGAARMADLGMPCETNVLEANHQATSRSMHPGGVHVLTLDGSVHFVNENINPQIWHNMHSKDATASFELQFDE
jgi:hypothetical protein